MNSSYQALPHCVSLMTTSPKATMSKSVYGIDLAKHSFSIHREDHQGKVLMHKTILRQSVAG
ncbi:hypothetical protein KCG43_15765 [Photobacterium sp. WH24]|uniref:hypothetical protein n=1 Tax=Photobacterium sp. WH24 TaxID=2827237 RepID=UPI001C44960D|nr:hypothetical protein [Photobacterium sp. WH24]MBV7263460.1 hypothetical protein [Photobacterium sp. WH24]